MKVLQWIPILLFCAHSVFPATIRYPRAANDAVEEINKLRKKHGGMHPLQINPSLVDKAKNFKCTDENGPNYRIAAMDGNKNFKMTMVLALLGMAVTAKDPKQVEELKSEMEKKGAPPFVEVLNKRQSDIGCAHVYCKHPIPPKVLEIAPQLKERYGVEFEKGDIEMDTVCFLGPSGTLGMGDYDAPEMGTVVVQAKTMTEEKTNLKPTKIEEKEIREREGGNGGVISANQASPASSQSTTVSSNTASAVVPLSMILAITASLL